MSRAFEFVFYFYYFFYSFFICACVPRASSCPVASLRLFRFAVYCEQVRMEYVTPFPYCLFVTSCADTPLCRCPRFSRSAPNFYLRSPRHRRFTSRLSLRSWSLQLAATAPMNQGGCCRWWSAVGNRSLEQVATFCHVSGNVHGVNAYEFFHGRSPHVRNYVTLSSPWDGEGRTWRRL